MSEAFRTQLLESMRAVSAQAWNDLLAQQLQPTPFMRHEYLGALEDSGSATAGNGWLVRAVTLWQGSRLMAACPLYVKTHSWGEYVFDHAWAEAYRQHGLHYYPKGVVAVPFTPVPGSRLLARSAQWRVRLLHALQHAARRGGLSSLHLLFGDARDLAACEAAGWMLRNGAVRFHWHNRKNGGGRWRDFEDFLADLSQYKRKKIRQERRRVARAGVRFRVLQGRDITAQDWRFFWHCYERTYLEHGNSPYLTPEFFHTVAHGLEAHWVMFVAEHEGKPVASSLIAIGTSEEKNKNIKAREKFVCPVQTDMLSGATAHGRYWGALQRVDCLHFEACYYQPIDWCIAHGLDGFDGGVQGAHKAARALLPQAAPSAHWVLDGDFSRAIAHFLAQEAAHVDDYVQHVRAHSALRDP